jgi:DNA-binding transcriptional ArsR family regulator
MVKCLDGLNGVFAALSDPTRREILDRLSRETVSVSDLATGRRMTLAAVLKHLSVLERAGLVRTEKSGRVRSCGLTARPLREATAWLNRYRPLWEARLDRLSDYLNKSKGEDR